MRSLFSTLWAGIRAAWIFVTLPIAWLAAFLGGRPSPAPGLEAYAAAATAMPVNDVLSDDEIRIAEMASKIRAAASARLDALDSGDLDLARAADDRLPPGLGGWLDRCSQDDLRSIARMDAQGIWRILGEFTDGKKANAYKLIAISPRSIACIEAAANEASDESLLVATGYRRPFPDRLASDRLASVQSRRAEEQASADEDLTIRFGR